MAMIFCWTKYILLSNGDAAQVRGIAVSAQTALTPALVAAFNDISRPLKEALEPNAYLWQNESRVV